MRVIAGTARRLLLDTPKGLATRPTTDRIKETLFNIINNDLPGADFLDLFAGSGAIGIEALSRGCKSAVFVENDRAALSCIKENLRRTGLMGAARVMPMEVMGALASLKDAPPFGIIFMDPPYRQGLTGKVLRMLAESNACAGDTLVILEEALGEETGFVSECGFNVVREKCYKTNKHLFVKKK
ncbi:MAG: 16S rRNA (guanine(966)-N(2))-methyltransferase RsmD [Lachnospiraceae bacterium]|nr:16S rRNA (guanine(966)-N(2))-methyltransferase RsmD [Lachnospiraceae bacterium]